ncbi:CBS domain-containing protein [Ferrovum myxofaciens]|uniref:CBS domain-containing protein n=1 Tax=Ferrovum myxofaciens TaxID=416213 RepID=UPI0023558113|nr:CBS domain-containing protein [Ferrovum myxofaciens]MBU6995898.1 CBS domain-containing protein [Ferrovum myxofaciens]
MFVGMWMTWDLLTVNPETPIDEIANLMATRRIRRLPVVEKLPNGLKLLGIISHTDILHAFPAEINPFSVVGADILAERYKQSGEAVITAAEIMKSNPLTVTADEPIERAARLMREHKIGALPVVRDDVLVGLISESDIFKAFISIFEASSPGKRITFDISQGEDVFFLVAEQAKKHKLRVITYVTLQNHSRPLCVVEVIGSGVDAMLEDIWKSKHAVVSVINVPG